jgi:hypothetical protein
MDVGFTLNTGVPCRSMAGNRNGVECDMTVASAHPTKAETTAIMLRTA